MAVYVDKARWNLGNMKMCHMVADSIEELHEMAKRIGVNQKHFQSKRLPHYDICKSKRELAMKYGAQCVSSKVIVLKSKVMQ